MTVPRHTGDKHSHPTSVGHAGEDESSADKRGKCNPVRIYEVAERGSNEHERTGGNANLSFKRHDLRSANEWESSRVPC